MKTIAIVTGTRAEYGLLRRLIYLIEQSAKLTLQLYVTGTHLSPEYGLTKNEIIEDDVTIYGQIDIQPNSDSSISIAKSSGNAMLGFADMLNKSKPDIILVVGDRYEILAVTFTALLFQIPIAHIHGGEITQAVMDDSIRHAITKLSSLHFAATEHYKNRIIQMGEYPNTVFNVGGLGVDCILNQELLKKSDLESQLNIIFKKKNLLITFHPVISPTQSVKEQTNELLKALSSLENTLCIFTMPNADLDGHAILNLVKSYCQSHKSAYYFHSLGQIRYLSCLQFVDAVVGNSSSGLLEVPTFSKPTINIGSRQDGRLKSKSVIDCTPHMNSILSSIELAYTKDFLQSIQTATNPYGKGGASEKIINILENLDYAELNNTKKFYDLK